MVYTGRIGRSAWGRQAGGRGRRARAKSEACEVLSVPGVLNVPEVVSVLKRLRERTMLYP